MFYEATSTSCDILSDFQHILQPVSDSNICQRSSVNSERKSVQCLRHAPNIKLPETISF